MQAILLLMLNYKDSLIKKNPSPPCVQLESVWLQTQSIRSPRFKCVIESSHKVGEQLQCIFGHHYHHLRHHVNPLFYRVLFLKISFHPLMERRFVWMCLCHANISVANHGWCFCNVIYATRIDTSIIYLNCNQIDRSTDSEILGYIARYCCIVIHLP